MRCLGLSLCLLLVACGGRPPPAASESLSPLRARPVTEPDRYDLRIRTSTRLASFSRAQSIVVDDLEGHRVRVDAPSWQQLHQRIGDDGLLQYQVYGPLAFRRDGELTEASPLARGLPGHQLRTVVDVHGRISEGPALAGSPAADRRLSAAVLTLSRVVQPRLPDHPVAVGESWEDRSRWRTPPWDGAVVLIHRRWTLVDVEGEGDERRARIAWDVRFRVEPFEISGVSIDARGRLEGLSELSMGDGVTGWTALELNLEAGPAGVGGALSLYHLRARITDRVEPRTGARGDLLQPVRPSGARGRRAMGGRLSASPAPPRRASRRRAPGSRRPPRFEWLRARRRGWRARSALGVRTSSGALSPSARAG